MNKVLFLDECNCNFKENPLASLIEFNIDIDLGALKELESKQLGVERVGGSLSKLIKDSNLQQNVVHKEAWFTKRKSDFDSNQYDCIYTMINGNY